MNEPIDLQARQAALNPAESFIVQAPAGSGKTELLIQRYLRVLSLVNAPEEIVAITFTRKAAAEMRDRIINAFEQASSQQVALEGASELTQQLVKDVIARDRQQGWQLFDNPARLRIQTIDSLTASLTRQMPMLSRFGAQPETIDKADELYQLAAVNTLAELESGDSWSEAIAVLLKHLDNDLPRVRNMLAAMLARRDQWLRHLPEQQHRDSLEAGLRHLVEAMLKRVNDCIPSSFHEELICLLRFAGQNLKELESESILSTCFDVESVPGRQASDLQKWRAISTLLLTKDGGWRKTANVKLGFPPASGSKTHGEIRAAMKTRFFALLANMAEEPGLAATLVEINYLPDVHYSDSEWQVVEALYQLLLLADAQLRLLFAERNQMDFSGIALAAIQALGNADEPSDLALQLDHQIKHILVDEFQDISINQYVLLEKLSAGWSSEDGHSLFLVGDPMQSIYRFREAEVGIFLSVWKYRRLNQLALTPINISVNFRSEPGIVDWTNEVFEQVLAATDEPGTGAVNYVRANAYHSVNISDPVKLHPLLSRNDTQEAARVLDLLRQAREEDAEASIAILVRNRSHLQEIVSQLQHSSMSYQAVEIESMGQSPAIQDLLVLTLAMTHLADRIAWLALLRAPWCGLLLADLHKLGAGQAGLTIWDCINDEELRRTLSVEAQLRLQKLQEVLSMAFAEQGRRRLSRWIESVWMAIGGPACLINESDIENSRTFFQLLDEFDEGGDLKAREVFIERVESLFAVADLSRPGVVQIMTIHKAKGLEFDTVILPGLARGSRADDSRLLLWMETPHAGGHDLLLAPIKETGQSESLIYAYLKRLENEKKKSELGRLLYVAVTRAKKHLHIIATAEPDEEDNDRNIIPPRRDSLLAQLWPVIGGDFERLLEEQQPASDLKELTIDKPHFRRLRADWSMPLAPKPLIDRTIAMAETSGSDAGLIEYEWAGETIKHIGTVVHYCIRSLAETGIEGWDSTKIADRNSYYQTLLKALGLADNEIEDASQQVQKALTNILDDERGLWLFSDSHIEVRNEYALSGVINDKIVNVILDRTFIDSEGIRWVVDYKTSRHEHSDVEDFLDQQQQRYQGQLEKYGKMMKKLENRPIRLGLYFPLLQGWRDWSLSE